MRTMRWTEGAALAVGALLAVVAMATSASAQYTLGGYNVEGYVEAGYRLLADQPSKSERAKFEEYRDISSGLFLPALQLRLFAPDESYSAEILGSKWGQRDQEFGLRAGRLGLWQFGFDWDELRHVYSTDARMLSGRPEPNVFSLPFPRPGLSAHNTSPELDDVSVRWSTARTFLLFTPTPDIDLSLAYTRIKKEGDRPFSMAFGSPGSNFLEILEPIDQTIHDFRLRGTYAQENWQVQFGYGFSLFSNGFRQVIADNPCRGVAACGTAGSSATTGDAVGPQTGQVSLAPDNMSHDFNLAAGVNLPMRTRITASGTYAIHLQNDSFLPMTINPTLVALNSTTLRNPRPGLDGFVGTLTFNTVLTSRPIAPLTLTAKYRLFDYKDTTDALIWERVAVDDRAPGATSTRRAGRENYTKQNADVDARWRFSQALATTVGVGWEHWERNHVREVEDSDEAFAKAAIDVTPTDWLLARFTYRPSFRRTSAYDRLAPYQDTFPVQGVLFADPAAVNAIGFRKFDEAARNRQQADLLLQFTPFDTVTAALTGSVRDDDYIESRQGLQEETALTAGFDLSWAPAERVAFSFGYVHEINNRRMTSQQRISATSVVISSPTWMWDSNTYDTIDTFHLNGTVALIPGLLDWKFGGAYMMSLSEDKLHNLVPLTPIGGTTLSAQMGATTKRFPALEDSIFRIDTTFRYMFAKNWSANLGYIFEMFEKKDWRTDNLVPSVNPALTSVWLGSDLKDYTAHILALTVGYRFK
jgi:MtrB/PioB family decaheme-associated outer membrane protein